MRTAAVVLALLLAACSRPAGTLQASEGWIRASAVDGPMAGYLSLHNGTASDLRCDGASGADFGAIEIHRTSVENGMSRMLRDQVVAVRAGGSARLEPGSYHLMLFRPQRTLPAGSSSRITLSCGALSVAADFIVKAQ
ncbi:MAG TPA: copper chaperone PCu(A)C [Solimonas sp.]|nr:copper chaperone PCu(A)C [Solimonas sp.]